MSNETRLREIMKDRYQTDRELAELVEKSLAELAALRAENAELRTEAKEMRKLAQLGTHRVIACGVAATNPDASLVERGAYADEWRTRQLDEVKSLRRDRDNLQQQLAALRARCEEAEAATNEVVVAHRVAKKILSGERFDPIAHSLATSFLDQKLSALAALKEAPRA